MTQLHGISIMGNEELLAMREQWVAYLASFQETLDKIDAEISKRGIVQ